MERRDQHRRVTHARERELGAAQLRDPFLGLQQELGREIAERHDHRGSDELELAVEPRCARLDLVRLRIAVAGRAALHDVRDVDVGAREADALDELGEELARPADERLALQVFAARPVLRPRTSDRHRPGRHRTRPACARPRACTTCTSTRRSRPRAASRLPGRGMRTTCERVGGCAGERVGGHGTPRGEKRMLAARNRAANGRRDDIGRRDPQPVEARRDLGSRAAVATASATSPSKRVCAGCSARANPSCALWASSRHAALSSAASVTTTTSVVFAGLPRTAPASGNRGVGTGARRSRNRRAVGRDDVADRVDHGERRDARPRRPWCPRHRDRRARPHPGPATCRPSRPAPAPTAPVSQRVGVGVGGHRGRVPVVGARGCAGTLEQVEDARGRDDRHRPGRGREPLAAFGEIAHHAVGGRQPERGTAGEHDRVDVRHGARRIEQVELTRGRRAPAHFARADGARREQHHGHAGAVSGDIPDAHSLDGKARHGVIVAHASPGRLDRRARSGSGAVGSMWARPARGLRDRRRARSACRSGAGARRDRRSSGCSRSAPR